MVGRALHNHLNKLGVKTIIVEKDKFLDNNSFNCRTEYLKRISRNIFLEKKVPVDLCLLKD